MRYFSSPSSDGWRLLFTFIVDYWYVPLIFIILMVFAAWTYKRIGRSFDTGEEGWKTRSVELLLFSGLIVLAGRGGLQLVPITLVDAGLYTTPRFMPLVLNTPFSFVVTAFQQKQEPLYYFSSPEEVEHYFSLNYQVKPSVAPSFKGKNVVVLILESFGQEYTGYYTKQKGFTPFLDSLLRQSYVFTNAFANGKQSVDAVPAILSGIPALTQEPFIASGYAANRMPSLASYFVEQGYQTQFFHGGVNGTMGFEAFAQSAGIQHYYGKSQYPNKDEDYDGNWGIFDEPYLQYFAHELTKNDNPFFSVLFTLSSHHPYTIPEKYKGKFHKGYYDIHESIGYADYALSRFFEESKKQPWYNNTLFVLTADHTAHSDLSFYQEGMGMYAVPIAFYDPSGHWKGVDSTIIQHIDLFPTLISLTGGDVKGKFFGRNVFDHTVQHDAITFNYGEMYHYLKDSLQVNFNGRHIQELYRYPQDSILKNNILDTKGATHLSMEHTIQAKIQTYYQNMEANTWYFEMGK
jgi:phosphoglycerol transferase MdoB-like AlkP superfamily enzyme